MRPMRSDARVPDIEDFRFSHEVEVRFRDLDAMGHVNNAVYLTYLEVARAAYMQGLGHASPDERSLPVLFPFVISDISCRFFSPVRLGDRLVVHVRADQVGAKSFLFDYLVTTVEDNHMVASAQSRQVSYDYAAGRSMPMPPELRRLLEKREGRRLIRNRPA